MANIYGYPKVELKIGLELNEEEAKALLCIAEYNMEDLLKILYTHMGERVVDEHKKGIISLFSTVRIPLDSWLVRMKSARKTFEA